MWRALGRWKVDRVLMRQVNAVLLRSYSARKTAELRVALMAQRVSIFSCMHMIRYLPALKLTMHHHISISTNTQISAAVLAIE